MALEEFVRMEVSNFNPYARSKYAPVTPEWKRLLQEAKIIVSMGEGRLGLQVQYPKKIILGTEYVLRADDLLADSHIAAIQEAIKLRDENLFPNHHPEMREYLKEKCAGVVRIFSELYL